MIESHRDQRLPAVAFGDHQRFGLTGRLGAMPGGLVEVLVKRRAGSGLTFQTVGEASASRRGQHHVLASRSHRAGLGVVRLQVWKEPKHESRHVFLKFAALVLGRRYANRHRIFSPTKKTRRSGRASSNFERFSEVSGWETLTPSIYQAEGPAAILFADLCPRDPEEHSDQGGLFGGRFVVDQQLCFKPSESGEDG